MLVLRYWKSAGDGQGVSPFGDRSRVLTEWAQAERVFRSVTTWCSLNGLAYRVGVCGDPSLHQSQLAGSAVEINRFADGDLVHATYVKKAWSYMHVLFRTVDRVGAHRMQRALVDMGRGIGRCENNDRDLDEAALRAPYFVYLLTGKLPPRNDTAPEPVTGSTTSLLSLADL